MSLNSIDILSSSSNDLDLTTGTLYLSIDDKAENDKKIIKKVEEETKSMF